MTHPNLSTGRQIRSLLVTAAALAAALAASACEWRRNPVIPAGSVSYIVVKGSGLTGGNRVIRDSIRIDSIMQFVNARRFGWARPFATTPSTHLDAQFHMRDSTNAEQPAVILGVCDNCLLILTADNGEYTMKIKSADDRQRVEFARLLGLSLEEYALASRDSLPKLQRAMSKR